MAVNPVSTIVAVGKVVWEGSKLVLNTIKTGATFISQYFEKQNAQLARTRTQKKMQSYDEKAEHEIEMQQLSIKKNHFKRQFIQTQQQTKEFNKIERNARAQVQQDEAEIGRRAGQVLSNQLNNNKNNKINALELEDSKNNMRYQQERSTLVTEITQNLEKGLKHQQVADKAQKEWVDYKKKSALSFKNTIQHYHQAMKEVRQFEQQGRQSDANERVAATLHQVAIDLIDYTAHHQQTLAENKGEIGRAIADYTSSLEMQHLVQLKDYVQQEIKAKVSARTATAFNQHQASRQNQAQIAHHQQNLGNMHQVAAMKHETSFAQAKQQSGVMESNHQRQLEAIQSGLEGAISQKENVHRVENKGSPAGSAMLSAASASHGRRANNDVQQQNQQTASMAIVPKKK